MLQVGEISLELSYEMSVGINLKKVNILRLDIESSSPNTSRTCLLFPMNKYSPNNCLLIFCSTFKMDIVRYQSLPNFKT